MSRLQASFDTLDDFGAVAYHREPTPRSVFVKQPSSFQIGQKHKRDVASARSHKLVADYARMHPMPLVEESGGIGVGGLVFGIVLLAVLVS